MNDPLFFVFAIPAVLLIGISKGFGGLFVSLAVPLLALRIDPVQAAAILLPILCLADLVALAQFRKSFNRHHIKIMVPGALVGIVLASILMGTLTSHAIRLIIGFIAISFCVNHWFFKRFTTERKPGKHAGYFWGFVAGFVSTQAHAGGPPMAIYLFPQRMDKVTLAGTMVVFIAIVNYVKLFPYTLLGQFDMGRDVKIMEHCSTRGVGRFSKEFGARPKPPNWHMCNRVNLPASKILPTVVFLNDLRVMRHYAPV